MTEEVGIFGSLLAELLDSKGVSLRELSRRSGIDASNLSKIERGVAYPPKKQATLEKLARALELDDTERVQFFDAASQTNGMLPKDLVTVKENVAIPMLLRAIDNRQLTHEEVRKLAEFVENENEWQGRIVD